MSIYFGFSSRLVLREILSTFQASAWFMPVPRKSTGYRAGSKSSRLADRNGHASSSRHVTKSGSPLVRQTSSGIPLLAVAPVYHKPAAVTPILSPAQFETLYFGFHVAMLILHCINIYQTNLHLIDAYLLLFIIMIVLQRILWLATKQTLASEVMHTTMYWLMVAAKAFVVVTLLSVTVAAMYLTVSNSSFEDVLFLGYPLGIYVWAFGLTLNPHSQKILLKINSHVSIHKTNVEQYPTGLVCSTCAIGRSKGASTSTSLPTRNSHNSDNDNLCSCRCVENVNKNVQTDDKEFCRNNNMAAQAHRSSTPQKNNTSVDDAIMTRQHCTIAPESIRYEAESLRVDFNLRLTQVVFNSLLSAYYIGFVPMKFTQNGYLHYDVWWSLQLTFYMWVTSFVLLFCHLIPYHYIDGLHRCAAHLGQWVPYLGKHEASEAWSGVTTWPHATLVQHQHSVYKSVAKQNSAMPGDVHQYRFYLLFHYPLRVHNIMVLIQVSSVICQLMSLFRSGNFQQLIAMATILSFNYVLLFRLLRERWAVAETMDEHESCTNSVP